MVTALLFLPLIASTQTYERDTMICGVGIHFTFSLSNFPSSWIPAPTNAAGESIKNKEIHRSKIVMEKALAKYPLAVLKANLRNIYFLRTMSFFGVGYGGTNSTDALYFTNDGIDNGYTDFYLEQNLHHEFSSILFRNFPEYLDTTSWKAANIEGFDYNDPEAGVGAIRKNQSSQDLDTALAKKGFLTQYAYSSLENDVNTLAQNLFMPDPEFWNFVNNYPRIRTKVNLLINFYSKLDASLNEEYFRKFLN